MGLRLPVYLLNESKIILVSLSHFSNFLNFLFKICPSLNSQNELDSVVADNDQRATDSSEQFRDHSLVHSLGPFFLHHLDKAINSPLVDSLSHRLLRLEHHASSDSVEGVVEGHNHSSSHSDRAERGDRSISTLVILPGIEVLDLLEAPKLAGSVDESTADRD